MDGLNFASIVSVAILGSFSHCAFMCGGFLSLQMLFLKDKSKFKSTLLISIYHLARICAYCLIGAIFGAFGSLFIFDTKIKGALFFIIGCALVFIGVALYFRGAFLKFIENAKFSNFITAKMIKFSHKKTMLNFTLLGFLNGFMPCGLVYYFAAQAILSHSAYKGALIMLIFGACSFVIFIIFSALFKFIGENFKKIISEILVFIIILNGIYLAFLGFKAYG